MIQSLNLILVRRLHVHPSSIEDGVTRASRLVELGTKWKNKTMSTTKLIPSQASSAQNIKYILSMFPYPSGVLHLGHLRVYVISDSLSRFYKQRGYDVIHPMGWDAFGLPAENAAIDRDCNPSTWTYDNIAKMKEQMKNMLANFDWDRELTTCSKDYYKFTQMIFLELYKHGLAYHKEAEINWDPVDKTVLANEQVDSTGHSWRSGALVEKKMLKQWFLGITKFGHALMNDLKYLDDWPAKVKSMQKNWISESKGVTVNFNTNDPNFKIIQIFTTRIETIFSVDYIALSASHPIVRARLQKDNSLKLFVENSSNLKNNSKDGYLLKDIEATFPFTGKKVPIFVAPYVISGYGTDAVMGVPVHDQRDFEFWQKNNNSKAASLPSILPSKVSITDDIPLPYTSLDGVTTEISGNFSGISPLVARKEITSALVRENIGQETVSFKMRDWLISRQRYWGTPIPIIYCDDCGPVPVPKEDLPVVLPQVKQIFNKGKTLAQLPEFVNTVCPKCKKHARRETDTMDTFMDSSWYFFRFLDPHNSNEPFSKNLATNGMPVDIYIGGVEHAILHLLYSRFISKFLGSISKWDDSEHLFEPFKKLVTQGMVHGKTYMDPDSKKYLKPEELEQSTDPKIPTKIKGSDKIPVITYTKMSKSKYNGVDPNKCIQEHGPDSVRAHILFQAPVEEVLDWDESKIVGIERWLTKLLGSVEQVSKLGKFSKDYELPTDLTDYEIQQHNKIHNLIKSITLSFKNFLSLNTVVSDYMKLTNLIQKELELNNIRSALLMKYTQQLVSVIYPIVPSISEEATEIINKEQGWNWSQYEWPDFETKLSPRKTKFKIVIDGKMKGFVEKEQGFYLQDHDKIIKDLKKENNIGSFIVESKIKKIITKHNLISFVSSRS
ncbi:hypothetical protein TBLA_0I02880 [Henningerozyma blattae CBS 6284]|uniref:leucine--tRNA ligase n=1 Tax=Henningerozyma blattae (strain ATCC 34711 / CBS 6284 / DSM 70876 / NBRC 10599 / NRRL Y-10934 / UCD 77-7) TaxID=1071380 RepID=I2H992_HENB6|nr:hypothetical protein TBLA_0I02880 [Tetrapisispora blattae CBS 6284]CCH62944.1 hypothetical protein TBLA_0I02880 [Tetrapisispora blattae CBS 6284]